jgi:hypothetical protein
MMPSAWLGLPFEPFLSDVTEPDRVAGLRAFAVLIAVHCGSDHPAVSALRCAEMERQHVEPGADRVRPAARAEAPEDHPDLREGDFATPPAGRRMMDATPTIDPIDYESIKALAAASERPANTLIAMSYSSDPFYVMPYRQAAAEWFAALWREHCRPWFMPRRPCSTPPHGPHTLLHTLHAVRSARSWRPPHPPRPRQPSRSSLRPGSALVV